MPSTSAQSKSPYFSAKYYDGVRAVAHSVNVLFGPHSLMIVGKDGSVLDTWMLEEVELGDRTNDWVRVAKKGTEARLSLHDPMVFDILLARAPNMMTRQRRLRQGMIVAVASTIAVIIGIYFAIPLMTHALVAVIPPSVETQLGDSTAQSLMDVVEHTEDRALCDTSPEGVTALNKMTQTLARHTNGAFPYRVEVLNVNMVNAIALPGGRIFLFKGLVEKAESADEVAGVLAHEMAHVDLRHSLHNLIRQTGLSVLTDMMFGGSSFSGVSSLLMGASYTREAEEAADAEALNILHSVGISTHGLAAFFERLHAQEDKAGFSLPGFMSTHPPSDKRAALAQSTEPSQVQILSRAEWINLQRICD